MRVCECAKLVRQQEFTKLRFRQILIFSTSRTIRQILPAKFFRYMVQKMCINIVTFPHIIYP